MATALTILFGHVDPSKPLMAEPSKGSSGMIQRLLSIGIRV